ncbi:MAG: SpoIID/LytB domain-containing protein [Thermoleophilaceae bacterium]
MIRRPALIAVAVALLAPATASADLRIEGRGFGHGIGMSQYGAYGYALRENRDFRWILAHYYQGTEVTDTRARIVRVLLKQSSSQKICGATRARGADGRRERLSSRRSYRFYRSGRDSLRVYDDTRNRTIGRLRAPVRVSGDATVCLRGRAENGVRNGKYRGTFVLDRDGSRVRVINRVHSRHYLYGVVPAEVPTSWPMEAVKAQAVAARTYAFKRLLPDQDHDVFADTRSQVYRGVTAENTRGREAVRDTRELVVTYRGDLADTFFFSTSGGRTAGNEEIWNAAPVPYLRSVEDEYDHLSPVHTWTESLSRSEAERRLGSFVRGTLEDVRVTERTASGRAKTVEIRGSGGTRSASGTELRSRLGLRSSWFTAEGP